MSKLILFWHRRDLRISDNMGLAAARKQSSKIVGVFCLDPNILNSNEVAPARVTYMLGCLQELEESYSKIGSQLLIVRGEPIEAIPQLAVALQVTGVFWHKDGEPYARERDGKVEQELLKQGIAVTNYWDQLLHPPEDILTQSGKPYTVYTPFWKNWSQKPKLEVAEKLDQIQGLTAEEIKIAQETGVVSLPTGKDLGYYWDGELILTPGETAAREQLEEFSGRAIAQYQEQRNFPAVEGTSLLSPALRFGVIGIRTVWQATLEATKNSYSEEVRANIETWQKELAWREFYQHALYHFPQLTVEPYRQQFKDFPWDNNPEHFQAWCEGKTGYPMVDAAMRQLNETGWMHNRCRMIVASFLTKDLIINWQWGEQYFMQKLCDGDLASNNGGWQWSASCGMDPKPLRIFNPASQAKKFDPEGEYIRQWLPELSSIDTEYLVRGKIPDDERERCDYPQPIVDHNLRQREFKRRYQEQKNR